MIDWISKFVNLDDERRQKLVDEEIDGMTVLLLMDEGAINDFVRLLDLKFGPTIKLQNAIKTLIKAFIALDD